MEVEGRIGSKKFVKNPMCMQVRSGSLSDRLNKICIQKASDPAILSSNTVFGGPWARMLVGEREKEKGSSKTKWSTIQLASIIRS